MKFQEIERLIEVNKQHKNLFSKDAEKLKEFDYKKSKHEIFEELGIEQY